MAALPPSQTARNASSDSEERVGRRQQGKGIRILHIEDEPPLLRSCKRMLEQRGYSVEGTERGAEGIAKYIQGGFDLVLCDYLMPEMRGDEVIREIRRLNPDAKVMFLCGTGGQEVREQLLGLGAIAVLKKPIEIEPLHRAIQEALGNAVAEPFEEPLMDCGDRVSMVRRQTKVLFVDDDPETLMRYAEIAAGAGFRPVTALGGSDALGIMIENGADIVVTHLDMPEMDGRKLLRALRGSHPDLKVIVVSGEKGTYHELKDAGAYAVISTSSGPEDIIGILHDAVEMSEQPGND
jgi:CheY-like chemotaxis protein